MFKLCTSVNFLGGSPCSLEFPIVLGTGQFNGEAKPILLLEQENKISHDFQQEVDIKRQDVFFTHY